MSVFESAFKLKTIHRSLFNLKMNRLIRRLSTETYHNTNSDFVHRFEHSRISASPLQRMILGAGSSIMSLVDPSRAGK